jgi:hypothetical protein
VFHYVSFLRICGQFREILSMFNFVRVIVFYDFKNTLRFFNFILFIIFFYSIVFKVETLEANHLKPNERRVVYPWPIEPTRGLGGGRGITQSTRGTYHLCVVTPMCQVRPNWTPSPSGFNLINLASERGRSKTLKAR